MKQHIEPEIAYFPPTYILNSSIFTAKIINDDNKIFPYEWRLYGTKEEDQLKFDIYSPDDRDKLHSCFLFNSDIFSIEPISGSIWPHLSEQFVITFNPKIPNNYKQIVYLYNTETEERIPYEINANGIQPSAAFSISQIDVMHVPLDKPKTFVVDLINTGNVAFDFEYEKRNPKHLKFTFSPESGHLEVGESVQITALFAANYVGQFNETFHYKIVGYEHGRPSITFYGRVIGASYSISTNKIDFGNVSYGFLYSKEFEISNTSSIPFDYALTFKQDKSFDIREFSIRPSLGSVPKHSKQIIHVEFIPISVQTYEISLLIAGTKSEENYGSMKIVANCICPVISLSENVIDLGNLFIHHEYTTSVNLVDDTDFPAKYEFIEVDDESTHDMNITFVKYKGSISPHSTFAAPIKVIPKQLGHLKLYRSIRIYGSTLPPIDYTIKCLCTGPNLVYSSNVIDFGNTPVLQDIVKVFPIKNDSLIPATFNFTLSQNSMFAIEPTEGEIKPGETLDLIITVNLDDSISYNSNLIMNVQYLTPITFELKAKGIGTAIVSSADMKQIDMGFVFTLQPAIFDFTLTNKGRRTQEIKWVQQKPKIEGNNRAVMNYKILPDSFDIAPKQSINCRMTFECNLQCAFSLIPVCQASIGKQRYDLFKPEVKGIFIKPMITFGSDRLTFTYIHDADKEEKLTGKLTTDQLISPSQELLMPITMGDTIKNNSELPLEIQVQSDKPFETSPSSFFLQPQEMQPFNITFNPSYKKNFTSETIERKIRFAFHDNPQKYNVNVKALMIFPNLSFSPKTSVNFGTLLKGTEETKIIKVTNTSDTQARFFWELKNTQTFDIFPINDILEPNESKDVHITFFAGEGNSFKNTAVCHVIGGPEYPIELVGSSSDIDYTLDKRAIDFGQRDYMETLSDKIMLTNNSRVPIQYNVQIPKGLGFQSFSIDPHKGVLNYKEAVTFSFKIVAGYPKTYNSLFMIQIGRFDEVQIDLHVDCYIPQLTFSVPHYKANLDLNETQSIQTEKASNKGLNLSLEDERKYMIEEFTAKKNQKRALQKLGTIYNYRGIYLSSYVIDFGEIILGDNKTIKCDLKNVTPYPISFDINQNSLSGTGFSINSTSFRHIPTEEVISIEVNFNSEQRTHGMGPIDFEIPLIFNNELGYMIHIVGNIKMPYLNFSKTCFTFEPTIIGQKWTQTFQLQNMNPIPVTFKIGDCQNLVNSLASHTIFTCFPTNGVLPAYSFINIEITFSPTSETNYQMQFPINIKYSDQVMIQVKGSGIMLKLAFDPPNINFDSIQPFNEKAITTVDLVNNSSIEIEVYSRQFDFELLCNQLTKKVYELNNISPDDIPLVSFSKPITNEVTKYSQVIIVHGPPKSGKTAVSEKISKMLQIPILNLKNLLQDKVESSDEDIIALIQDSINDRQYLRGFVVDGLDAFPENSPDNEQFIMHFLKQKTTLDELAKNPYTILNDTICTSPERLLSLFIQALNGQFVFFIGLNANETVCHSHETKIQDEERQAKITQLQDEMNALFNMDEDSYMKLSEEEQKAVDEKRERYRRYKIEHNGDFTDFDPFDDGDGTKTSNKAHQRKKSKVPRGQVPNDPLLQSVILFQYTFGRLCQRIQNDSHNIKNLYADMSKDEAEDQVVQAEKVEQTGKKKKEEQILKSIQSTNCLIVNSFETIAVVMNEITSFLPQREDFIQKASNIPAPRCEFPDSSNIDLVPFPQWFAIINEESPGEFPDIVKPVSPTTQKRQRKALSSTRALEACSVIQTDVDLISDIDVMSYTPRWKIPARSRMTIKLSFDSICQGTFSDNLLFGITNCRNDIYKIPVQGKCDYPEIDRSIKSLVPKIVNTFPKKHSITNVFVTKTAEFYMGSVLIVKERTRNGQAAYKASLNLQNNSEFTVETRSDLKLSGNKVPWVIENPNQKIPPGETGNIVIGFNPTSVDTFRNRLTVMVKDNPEPLCLDLIGEGCSPACEISTTALDFEKLLPSMSRTLSFSIKNTGKLSAFWKMKGGNILGNNFTITATEGVLAEGASVTVEIKYQAERPFTAKKTIQIDIFDVNKNRAFMSHHLNITAETFDVLFDFIYPKGMDHLNFGTLKVEQEKTLQCQLKNKGKYPSTFSIFTSKTFKYANMFTITPKEGTIPIGDKLINVNFTFKCDSSKKFTSCSGINLSLADPINDKVTSTVTVPFSVETVYSNFSLSPEKFVDFGPIPISTTVTKEIVLKNNGVFPFDFEILPKIEIVEPQKSGNLNNGKGRKLQNGKKGNPRLTTAVKGKKKSSGKDFQIDHFHVGQSAGTLNNENEIPVSISFNSNSDGVFENNIIYKIGDCMPKYNEGVEIKLKAAAYIPGIITDDFEKIFPNQHLCLRYDIASKDTSAFIEDEQIWHFSPVVVKQSSKVSIALINPLPIPCTVDINLKSRQRTQSKFFPFEISSKSVNIDSNSTSLIDLTFTPNTTELYRALFEATVRGGVNPSTKSMKFGIEGPGALPTISLVECENPNSTSILFGKSLVKTAKHKRISIQNNGIIPATVKISTTESEDFELENSDRIKQITLEVRQLYTFHIIHCPLTNRKSQFNVLLEVENNPNSNINIDCQGEGFREDLFFEGIQGDENELHFNSVIGQPQQITFQMRNVCENDVRFVFPNHNDFTFTPRVGQILHGRKKKITVTFLADKQTKYNGLKLNCQWQKIKIPENQIADWDDSMKLIKFVDRSSLNPYPLKMPSNDDRPKGTGRRFPGRSRRVSTAAPIPNVSFTPAYDANGQLSDLIKIVELKPEPQYTVINGRQKDIQLRIFAINDLIKYTISTTEIEFASTMMFEKRTLEFTMTNTSQISFEFIWKVKKFDSFKTDYSSSHSCPFAIQPQFGSIEADQTQTFLVNFVPEEVDDFSAQFICEIPSLTELPQPEVHVTGRSRRPVCHFDLETSDYISAGRRHPDYTDPLPDNIKVIEMFAFDLKKSTIKKFGILNTTNTPYEVTWERISKGDCPITCDTPHALISSGRKHMAQFSYKAASVKTVESLWLFSIPEYNINITFLIVGRMMPR